MEINYYRKDVYGNTLYYICDEKYATGIRRLTGTKTISKDQMALIESLFEVKFNEVLPPK